MKKLILIIGAILSIGVSTETLAGLCITEFEADNATSCPSADLDNRCSNACPGWAAQPTKTVQCNPEAGKTPAGTYHYVVRCRW